MTNIRSGVQTDPAGLPHIPQPPAQVAGLWVRPISPSASGNRTDCAKTGSSELTVEIKQFLEAYPQTEFMDIACIDICGQLRGKRLPPSDFLKPWDGGVMLPYSVHLLTAFGETSDAGGFGISDGDPDGMGRPLPGTLVPVSWTPTGGSQVLMELTEQGGAITAFDPRQILKRTIDSLAQLGVRPVVAFELEFYLFEPRRNEQGFPVLAESIDQSHRDRRTDVYGFEALDANFGFFEMVDRCAREQGIEASVATSEYAAGQFEINLNHGVEAMLIADQCAMFRRLVKGVAMANGVRASFMAKPLLRCSGSGMHVHLSLIDETGVNIFSHGETATDNTKLRNAIAGMLATMTDSVALFAPNLNAYRRFQPDSYVPMTPDWGINHRAAACRIPGGDRKSRRVEHRVASADACPHLVLAAILAGVEYGLRHELEPGPPVNDPSNRSNESIVAFPLNLHAGLEMLENSQMLGNALGADYLKLFTQTKRYEFSAFLEEPLAREFQWYL